MTPVVGKLLLPPLIFALSFAGCGKQAATPTPATSGPVTLTYWRPKTYSDPWPDALVGYLSNNKNVIIRYKTIDEKDYEQQVIDAIANGTGPDIWAIRNDELAKHAEKLLPAPDTLVTTKGIKQTYVPTVTADVIRDNKIYGLPMQIPVLRIIANQKLLRNIDVSKSDIPINWKDFIKLAEQATVLKDGKIVQSGLAIGSGDEVYAAPDLLALLMTQKGASLTTADHSQAAFHLFKRAPDGSLSYPGRDALRFYTDFANPKSDHYTWDPALGSALKAFSQGKVAMMINYENVIPFLNDLYPDLKIFTAPVPEEWQIDYPTETDPTKGDISKPIDYPHYWVEVVSKKTAHPTAAWQFLTDFALNYSVADRNMSPFKQATPTWFEDRLGADFAVDWSKGAYPRRTDLLFRQMADDVVKRGKSVEDALNNAAAEETKLLQASQ